MDVKDRRRHPRLEGQFPVDLLNMGDDPLVSPFEAVVAGTALDVSRHGMRLQISYNVAVGTLLSAVVYYRNRESVCLCEVVWKREFLSQPLYGLFIKQWSQLDPRLESSFRAMEQAESSPAESSGSLFQQATAA